MSIYTIPAAAVGPFTVGVPPPLQDAPPPPLRPPPHCMGPPGVRTGDVCPETPAQYIGAASGPASMEDSMAGACAGVSPVGSPPLTPSGYSDRFHELGSTVSSRDGAATTEHGYWTTPCGEICSTPHSEEQCHVGDVIAAHGVSSWEQWEQVPGSGFVQQSLWRPQLPSRVVLHPSRCYTKLFVGQLPQRPDVQPWLEALFKPYGVQEVQVRRVTAFDKRGRVCAKPATAFVWVKTREAALAAVSALDHYEYRNRQLWFNLSVTLCRTFAPLSE